MMATISSWSSSSSSLCMAARTNGRQLRVVGKLSHRDRSEDVLVVVTHHSVVLEPRAGVRAGLVVHRTARLVGFHPGRQQVLDRLLAVEELALVDQLSDLHL